MTRITLFAIPLLVLLGSTTVGVAQTTPKATEQAAPMAGANSFTENQAKDRIEKAGFTEVTGLRKDDQGIGAPMRSRATNRSTFLSISAATSLHSR